MSTINVLLEARAKDRGVKKFFRDSTKLADKFTASAEKAAVSGRKLQGINGGLSTGGGRGAGGRARQTRGSGRGRDPIAASMKKIARDRARMAKAENRQAARVVKQQLAAGRRQTKALNQQAKERDRQSRQIKNLSREQLEQLEVEREITSRRRRAASQAAKAKLGADPTKRAKGKGLPGKGRISVGADLAIAGQQFERFGTAVEGGVRTSFDAFKDFEKGIAEIETLGADITQEQIAKATKDAALAFGTLPTDQTAAFYAVVSAGATDAEGATEQLTAANRLAVGGVASTEEAVLAISKSLANFSSQGETATSAADKLFGAVQLGQVTVAEMAIALPKVAQTAGAAGLSLSETNAALAVLSKQSGSAKLGATNLDEALRQLIAPTEKADGVILKLSKRLEKAGGSGIRAGALGLTEAGGLEGFLKLIKSAGATDKDLKQIFGGSGFKAIRGLTESLADTEKGFAATEKVIKGSKGLSLSASNKIMGTASKRAEVLEAKFELLKIQAGESLVPALTDLAAEVGPMISDFTTWIKENSELAGTLGKVAIGVAVAARGVGLLVSVMSMASTISGITAKSFGRTAASTTAMGTAAATTTGKVSKLSQVGSGLKIGMAAAGVAVIAFKLVLNEAQEPLAKFEDTLDRVASKQQKISFGPTSEDIANMTALQEKLAELDAMDEPRGRRKKKQREEERRALNEQLAAARKKVTDSEKSEEVLGRERLNRQIEITNAATGAASESRGGGIADSDKNFLQKGAAAAGAGLNRATGVSDDLAAIAEQSQRDLSQLASQLQSEGALSVSEAKQFVIPGGDTAGGLDALQDLVETMRQVADNTATDPTLGSSLDGGLA